MLRASSGVSMRERYMLLAGITISRHAPAWALVAAAIGLTGCAGRATDPSPAFVGGEEHMPAFASIWLTSDPVAPDDPVRVEMTDPGDAGVHRSHVFPAGVDLRATFPVSTGAYRLIGLDGRCGIDLKLLPDREADVVLRLGADGSCSFRLDDDHALGDDVEHAEPAVLVAPDSVP
jgi:hypothetical protein